MDIRRKRLARQPSSWQPKHCHDVWAMRLSRRSVGHVDSIRAIRAAIREHLMWIISLWILCGVRAVLNTALVALLKIPGAGEHRLCLGGGAS